MTSIVVLAIKTLDVLSSREMNLLSCGKNDVSETNRKGVLAATPSSISSFTLPSSAQPHLPLPTYLSFPSAELHICPRSKEKAVGRQRHALWAVGVDWWNIFFRLIIM